MNRLDFMAYSYGAIALVLAYAGRDVASYILIGAMFASLIASAACDLMRERGK